MAPLDEEKSKKILRQVNFYFGDSNLPRDNFLMKTITESEDGMVSLALICSFTRMKTHLGLGDGKQVDISEETLKAVADVLKQSSIVKISEDGKKVGRINELAKLEEAIHQADLQTIAVSPLAHDIKLEDVESFFGKYAKVNCVRLPHHVGDKRVFCGSALVEFTSVAEAESVLQMKLMFSGAELELKPKNNFDAGKIWREDSKSNEKASYVEPPFSYPKGLIISFELNKICIKTTEEESADPVLKECEVNNGKINEDSTHDVDSNTCPSIHENGTDVSSVKEDEINPNEVGKTEKEKCDNDAEKESSRFISWVDLKAVFEKFGKVMFVDFKKGDKVGFVRYEEAESSQKARAAAVLSEESGFIIKNCLASVEPVTGDAERDYWTRINDNRDRRGMNNRGGRGGRARNFNRKRPNMGDDSHEHPAKTLKV